MPSVAVTSSGQLKSLGKQSQLYDGCPYVELLSAQGSRPLDNWHLSSGAQYLVKSQPTQPKSLRNNGSTDLKVYERDLKGFCFHCHGSTRFSYPSSGGGGVSSMGKQQKQAAVVPGSEDHPVLVMQVWIPFGEQFLVEVACLDSSLKNSRRIVISSAVKGRKNAAMHTQLPLDLLNSQDPLDQGPLFDVWVNVVVDLRSVVQAAFKDDFVGVQSLSLGGPRSKIRKVFLCRDKVEISTIEKGGELFTKKGLDLPVDVLHRTVVIDLDHEIEKAQRRFSTPQPLPPQRIQTSPSKSSSSSPTKSSPRKPLDVPRFKLTRPMSNPAEHNDHVQVLKQKGSLATADFVDDVDDTLKRILTKNQQRADSAPVKSPKRLLTIIPRPLKRNERSISKVSIISEPTKRQQTPLVDETEVVCENDDDIQRSPSTVPHFPDDDDTMTYPGDKSKSPEPVDRPEFAPTDAEEATSYSAEPAITFEFNGSETTANFVENGVAVENDQEYNDIKKWIAGSDDLIQSTSKLLADLRVEVEEAIAEENRPSEMKLRSVAAEAGASNDSIIKGYYDF